MKQINIKWQKILGVIFAQIYALLLKPFSRIWRQFFELKQIKQIFGSLMTVSFLAMAVLPSSLSDYQANTEVSQTEIQIDLGNIETEASLRLPLENFKISQGFTFYHKGVDFAASNGTPIYPIMEGYIEGITYSYFGYGNHVYINHGNGIKTLYAHLAKVTVKENEFVNKDSLLGTVGSTGWSTGPHLHFQIWEGDNLVNPITFFETYTGQKLTGTK